MNLPANTGNLHDNIRLGIMKGQSCQPIPRSGHILGDNEDLVYITCMRFRKTNALCVMVTT